MDASLLIGSMREAVQAEKLAVQKALGALGTLGRLPVSNGRRLHTDPGAQVYRFTCDVDFTIPEGTRVQLHLPGQVGSGETLRHDVHGDQLDCVFREDLGQEVLSAKIEFDSTFLLNLLEERLAAIAGGPSIDGTAAAPFEPFNRELGLAFLSGERRQLPAASTCFPDLAESQQAALQFVLGQEVAYLWGPPGTGKTQTVSHLVHALMDRREKVLLTAHTNIATDNALLRVLQVRRLQRDEVVRVGTHAESLAEHDVSLDAAVDRRLARSHAGLAEELASICAAVAELHPRHGRALAGRRAPLPRVFHIASGLVEVHGCGSETDLPSRIAAASKQLEMLERVVLSSARLVATTLTRCYSSKLFREFRTDSVVVDESSTASLALSFVVACLARRRAIAVGDFKQLPTIVQATHPAALRWLGRHVFDSSGADDVKVDHPLRAMLHEQWRMHPGISRVVSRVFYGGRLTDAPEVVKRAHPSPSVALVDTGRLSPRSESSASGSKLNRQHADLIARLLALGAPLDSVAVITPYRAQVRVIRDAVRAARPELLKTEHVEIFTVHRFQGRDKDVVIFDLVEAPGTGCAFLDELKTQHAPNLINVAMSRARERLVVVGAFDHLRRVLGSKSIVNQVLAAARTAGAIELEAGHDLDQAQLARFLRGEVPG